MLLKFWQYFLENDYHLIIIYIVLGYIVYEIIKRCLNKYTKSFRKKRQKTIQKLIQNIIKYIIILLVTARILSIIGINISSIVAGLGVASIILSLSLKDVMQDILSGVSIILEDQFDIGDLVEINGFMGTVIDLGLKSTKIKNYENIIKTISNRTITEVSNYSKSAPNIIMTIPMSYDVDSKLAKKVINNIIKEAQKLENLTGEIKFLGLNSFKESYIEYTLMVPVKIDEQFALKRMINQIIKEEYDKAGVSVPFNIIEVKNG